LFEKEKHEGFAFKSWDYVLLGGDVGEELTFADKDEKMEKHPFKDWKALHSAGRLTRPILGSKPNYWWTFFGHETKGGDPRGDVLRILHKLEIVRLLCALPVCVCARAPLRLHL